MRLDQLLASVERAYAPEAIRPVSGLEPGAIEIGGLSSDSRAVRAGHLFAALPGVQADGAGYAAEALANGAAILLLQEPRPDLAVTQLIHPEPRRVLAGLAAAFYDHPSRHLRLIGVTGTNGKTTIAYGVRHLLRSAGVPCGMLGTIAYDTLEKVVPAPLTTPESVGFSRALAEMRLAGAVVAMVEVSSHSLAQSRVDGHRFACGIFTNLTRDHLDYHGDLESYGAAKRRLFAGLDAHALAIVNADDPWGQQMVDGAVCPTIFYGLGERAELRAELVASDLAGMTLRVRDGGWSGEIRTPLIGRYNAENLLAIYAAAVRSGLSPATAAVGLRTYAGPPGRLERIEGGAGRVAFVDYAHTDDALRSALNVLRPLTAGRLLLVFGCGGDRDRGKRPLMARVAEAGADQVIVTSDNPRTEDPQAIADEILVGFAEPGRVAVELDRKTAILRAVEAIRPGDVLLVAGKGHEDYQIVGTNRHSMDDRLLVRGAFEIAASR